MADKKPERGALFFIVLTVLIDGMGIGLIIPVMPSLIQELGSASVSDAATWGGILSTVFALMQFTFGPILGSLSDAKGRRPVLLLSMVVTVFNYVLMGLASSIYMLFLARVIGGAASGTIATASAYVSDISAPEEKTKRFGLIGAAMGAGFVFGPVIGGFLGEISPRTPFYGAALLAAFNTVYGYFALPESLKPEKRRPFSWKRANPISAIRSVAAFPFLRNALILFFIYSVAFNAFQSVWAYYGELQYGWTPKTLGYSLALFGVGTAIAQAVLLRPALAKLGERMTIIVALLVDIIVFIAIAFITNGTVAIFVAPIASLGALARPALQGLMAKQISDDQQGVLQGVVTSMGSLAMIVAPFIMTQTFSYFSVKGSSHFFPGAPFILAAGLLTICLIIVVRSKPVAPASATQKSPQKSTKKSPEKPAAAASKAAA